MASYLAPAVYVEEVSFRAPSIEGVGTTTTGFAGPTLTGPVGGVPPFGVVPPLLTSFGDFQTIYGGFDQLSLIPSTPADTRNINFLALSVKGFFDNGGSMLYVSRVFAGGSAAAAANCASNKVATDVVLSARFPGAFANNQTVTVTATATKIPLQNVASLPQGSLVATVVNPVPALGTVGNVAAQTAAGATTLTLAAALAAGALGTLPVRIVVDAGNAEAETLSVSAVDATNTKLTLGSATTLAHAANAKVDTLLTLAKSVALGDTTITISVALDGTQSSIQIDNEIFGVTNAAGTTLTVTRGQGGTTAATHAVAAPVLVPGTTALYENQTGTTFSGSGGNLPSTVPAGTTVYVLTLRVSSFAAASPLVTATTAASQMQTWDGLGFHQAHPSYVGSMLAAVPPRSIDALENQIAFTITPGLSAANLFKELFGALASPALALSATYTLANGSDGGEPVSGDYDAALQLFEGLEDIAIVAAPGSSNFSGITPQAIIDSLITHVSRQRAYRVAILDTPANEVAADNENVRAQIDTSYAALYVPWVIMSNPLARSGTSIPAEVAVPPSGFIAGIYARSDDQNSVAKAPANEVVLDALNFERQITFGEQATLNPLGINCLRYFPDRGYRVWGARTTSSDTEFMYINVRRYLIYLEHSIDNSTQWAVFENNGPSLWARVKDSIDSFLNNEFVEGNLLGTSPSDAYFVRCDRTTMTQNDLDNGRMICLIGVSLLKPAEFVIFRIGQTTSGASS